MNPDDLQLPEGWEQWTPRRKLALRDYFRTMKFRLTYEHDPAAFAHDCIKWPKGEGLTIYQTETLEALEEHRRVSERGPHGLGKSATAAIVVLWFALTREGDDWKALTTASKWRQLQKFLWPEIHKWARLLDWAKIGREPFDEVRELQKLSLQLGTGEAFAVASNDPSAIEGAHADRVIYIYDEAKTITEDTFEATEGAFAGAGDDTGREAYGFALSTPGEPEGPFYGQHAGRVEWADWHPIHVTLEQAIKAGRISGQWAAARLKQWGEGSVAYQRRLLGNFATDAGTAVIPLEWVEAAFERFQDLAVQTIEGKWVVPAESLPPFTCAGWDVAGEGENDQTVVALRYGDVINEIRRPQYSPDLMEATGQVLGIHNKYGGYVVVDVIGIGGGPVSRLREKGARVVGFNGSERSDAFDESGELQYANLRAEAWFGLRDRLDPTKDAVLALVPDDQLTGDLTAPKKKPTSSGKLMVESKPDISKRLKRSPDTGDAVVMAMHARYKPMTTGNPAGRRLPAVGSSIGNFGR